MDASDLQSALDGRYEIIRELGRGGMAIVYLAHDLKHDRHVAIKVLPPELATSLGGERFLREIRTAAQLSHPNIVPLHDSIAVGRVFCYIMPYVQGESLRQRLDRERQLGIEQAVDIVRQVAAGLDYAHAHGIVHRDIKPENILLVGDQAMIADFGLARAVFTNSSTPFTETGIAVGTPPYMSPEQGAADHQVDGRTDIYSLACVFFEMVAGIPPFRGATAAAILAAHATRTPPSLCAERDSCPPSMDAAVHRALAKVPADRFHTAGEFAHALDTRTPSDAVPAFTRRRSRWTPLAIGAASLLGVAVLAIGVPRAMESVALSRTPLDSNRVLVLPIEGAGGRRLTSSVARQRLTSALMEWRDLQVIESSGTDSTRATDAAGGRRLARRAGAAKFVLATATPVADSVELRTTLFDAHGDQIRQRTIKVADDARDGSERYRQLTASLLRTSDGADDGDDALPGTARVAAWQAFTRGDSARRAWTLPLAESELRRAVALDPSFGRAHLWLAQVISWQHFSPTKEWGEEAGRALATSDKLSRSEALLASGLTALASGRFPAACASYRELHSLMPQSDLAWYGIGYCLGLDPIVVSSRTSPSGWSFRSSAFEAAAAFDSALAHAEGAPTFAYKMVGRLLITEPLRTRIGMADSPDSAAFYAIPSLLGDTLVSLPYPAIQVERGARPNLSTRGIALQRNVQHLDVLYRDWVRRAPRSQDAWMALGGIQELQGQPTALETIIKARTLTTSPDMQLALAITSARLLVKAGRFADARAVADSLLRATPNARGKQAEALSGVAALIGAVPRAAMLLSRAAEADGQQVFRSSYPPPAPVSDLAASFLVMASSGACTDSLRSFVQRLDRVLMQYAAEDQRAELRRATVVRPTSLAVPCLGPRAVVGLPNVDRLVRMQQYLAAGNTRAVRAAFDTLRTVRAGLRPGDIALDHTLQEAWLLLQLGDTAAAIKYLDLPLTALPTLDSHLLDDVPAASAVGRSFALRAELAASTGDGATAVRCASQVIALWSGATPELQPIVQRMRTLVASRGVTQRVVAH